MSKLSKNFIIDINDFEKLSREVGYYNCKANIKKYDKDNNESYDKNAIRTYEKLRTKQLTMQARLIKFYCK
jgi:hypothetical protein